MIGKWLYQKLGKCFCDILDTMKPWQEDQELARPGTVSPGFTSTWPTPVWPMPKSWSAGIPSTSRASPWRAAAAAGESIPAATGSSEKRFSGGRWNCPSWRTAARLGPTASEVVRQDLVASICFGATTAGWLISAGSVPSMSIPATFSSCRHPAAVAGARQKSDSSFSERSHKANN